MLKLKRAIARAGAAGTAGVLAVSGLAAAGAAPTRREAASLQQKVTVINSPRKQPRRIVITENELNAYFVFDAAKDLPAGVVNPAIQILGPGKLAAQAVVDLDAVRKASPPKSLLDPKNLLIGRLPLSASGTLTTKNGMGTFILEAASVGTIPLPKLLLQEIVGFYTRSADKPGGIDIDDPFALPANIREIQVTRGQAVIVQ